MHLTGTGRHVEQPFGRPAEDVASDQILLALAEDSNGLLHRTGRAAVNDRVVGDAAANAVFQFEAAMERVEELAVGDSAVAATDKCRRRAAFGRPGAAALRRQPAE